MYNEEIKKQVEYHLKKLNNEYARANTISKKKKIAYQLIRFENMCFNDLDDVIDIDSLKIDWLDDIQLSNFEVYNSERFVENLQIKNDFYNELSNKIINIYANLEYPFYKDNYKSGLISCYKKLSQKEFVEIIMNFIKEYDEEFLKKIDKKTVFLKDTGERLAAGKVSMYPSLQETYMFLPEQIEDSIAFYGMMAHEYGHMYEINLDFKSKNFNYQNAYSYSEFGEVSSIFFEYAFLMYLKKNKIYEDIVDCYLNYCYFIPLFKEFATINILSKIDNKEENVIITDDILKNEINMIKEKVNYYDYLEVDETVNYRRNYLYGLGKLMAIYLYDNYEQEPEKFKKEFRNSLLTYHLTNNISAFNNVGVSQEELLSCKKLTKTLDNFLNNR